ncbi:MAG: hypothetical protein ABR599_02035 [Gemmatimonadota bacterium]
MDLLRRAGARPLERAAGCAFGGLALAAALLAGAGCGARDRAEGIDERAGAPRPATGAGAERHAGADATAMPGAGATPQPPRGDTGAGTPRRLASQRLVEEGKGYWIAGRDEDARARFQEALRLDGSNGAAYYYLAELAADGRDWSRAEGYHAKAVSLLREREEFRRPLLDLAERIAGRR